VAPPARRAYSQGCVHVRYNKKRRTRTHHAHTHMLAKTLTRTRACWHTSIRTNESLLFADTQLSFAHNFPREGVTNFFECDYSFCRIFVLCLCIFAVYARPATHECKHSRIPSKLRIQGSETQYEISAIIRLGVCLGAYFCFGRGWIVLVHL